MRKHLYFVAAMLLLTFAVMLASRAQIPVFGQFVDHDLGQESSSPAGPRIDIAVPKGDPVFPEGTVIKMTRDVKSPVTHTVVNTTAGYLDLSQLYGSTAEVAASLRARGVAELKRLHPNWTGNQFYDMAKAITTAEYQNIIYTNTCRC